MTVVVSLSLTGLPTAQTTNAKRTAKPKLNNGPAKATMILSNAETGGSCSAELSVLPSIASMVAICGNETYPPAGIEPRQYSTPPILVFQIGLPNQMANRSTFN